MNLLSAITLYASTFAFLQLIFIYINQALVDPLDPYFNAGDAIRWPLSVIIIIFPTYIFVSRFLQRDLLKNPEKNELRVRRWLIYITIFAAGALIVGDLIALIYNFLEGDLTWRFVLKIVSVLLVAASIFSYYLYILKKGATKFSQQAKIFVWLAIVVVLAAVIYGFVLAGSPFRQRLARFDEKKVGDLQVLQSYVVNYWMLKGKLPNSLDSLKDSISGFVPPSDPQTNEAYTYEIAGDLSFKLCAVFNLASDDTALRQVETPPLVAPLPSKPLGGVEESWAHEAGAACFERTIDPELYKAPKTD